MKTAKPRGGWIHEHARIIKLSTIYDERGLTIKATLRGKRWTTDLEFEKKPLPFLGLREAFEANRELTLSEMRELAACASTWPTNKILTWHQQAREAMAREAFRQVDEAEPKPSGIYQKATEAAGQHGLCLVFDDNVPPGVVKMVLIDDWVDGGEQAGVYINPSEREQL